MNNELIRINPKNCMNENVIPTLLSDKDSEKVLQYFFDWIDTILIHVIDEQQDSAMSLIEYKKNHPNCSDEVHWDDDWLKNGVPADTIESWFQDVLHENVKDRVADYSWDDDTDLYDVCSMFMISIFDKCYKGKTINIDDLNADSY